MRIEMKIPRYRVDSRVGHVAVIDTTIPAPSPVSHQYDAHVVWYRRGAWIPFYGFEFWHVPAFRVRAAHRICKLLNEIDRLEKDLEG